MYHGPYKEPHETMWWRPNGPETLFVLVRVGRVRRRHVRHLFQAFRGASLRASEVVA